MTTRKKTRQEKPSPRQGRKRIKIYRGRATFAAIITSMDFREPHVAITI